MQPWVLAVVSVLLSVAAQFALKAGVRGQAGTSPWLMLAEPLVIGGFVLYGLGALVWLSVLSRWDVSKAYPLVGLGFVLTALVGWALGEQVGAGRWLGIGLICAGVVLVGRS